MKNLKYILYLTVITSSLNCLADHPMGISFAEMIEQSKTIVIAEFLGPSNTSYNDSLNPFSYLGNYSLRVHKVLKGNIETTTIELSRAHGTIYLEKNKRFIAFINKENQFEWYGGIPTKDRGIRGDSLDNLENNMIMMAGFYDFNAYLVSPSTISYTNLVQYIENGYMTNKIEGKIHFFEPVTGKMEPSNMTIYISNYYSADSTSSVVTQDNIPLVDFRNASASIGSWDPVVYVEYETNLVRPFTLIGQLSSACNGNELTAMFWVEVPEELNKQELRRYLGDPSLGPPVYHIEIAVEDGPNYTLLRQASPPSSVLKEGAIHWSFSSSGDPTHEEEGHINWDNGTIMTINKYRNNGKERGYTREKLVRSLRIAPLEGTVTYPKTWKKEPNPKRFTMRLENTTFSKNPNYKN